MTPSRGRRKPGAGPRKPYRGPGALDILGVDVGGVIVDRVAEGTDTSFFGERPLETPAVPGAVDGLRTLAKRFDGRVYVVSKAGPKFSSLTRAWLGHHDVYARTGVPQDHLFFVRDRKDKAQVCERFGITHFIDDRLEVLVYLDTVDHRYLFVGGLGRHAPSSGVPPGIVVVPSWPDLVVQVRPASQGS